MQNLAGLSFETHILTKEKKENKCEDTAVYLMFTHDFKREQRIFKGWDE